MFVDAGLSAGDVVALRARTRTEWLVVAWAASKIDATLLAVDPLLAPADLRRILIEAGAAAFICDDEAPGVLAPALAGLSLRLRATIDEPATGFRNLWDMFPAVAPPRFARSRPATIACMPGVSGPLRTVRIPQRRVALAAASKTPTPDDGVSLISLGLHHTYAAQQVWQALEAGRGMVLLPRYSPLAALRAIERWSVTDWKDFPEAFQHLRQAASARIRSFDLSSLRSIGVGGGGASPALKAWLTEMFGPIVTQSFGLPETGLIARLPAAHLTQRPGTCGRPERGVAVEIRSPTGHRLPPNATGEIWARTPGSIERQLVGDAGWRRDENDFFRTGVSGRMDEDGFLFLDPRADNGGSLPADEALIHLTRGSPQG